MLALITYRECNWEKEAVGLPVSPSRLQSPYPPGVVTYSGNLKSTCALPLELRNKFLSAAACSIILVCRSFRSAQRVL